MQTKRISVLKADDGMILKKSVEGQEPIYASSVMLAFGESASDWSEITLEQHEAETGGEA